MRFWHRILVSASGEPSVLARSIALASPGWENREQAERDRAEAPGVSDAIACRE